MSNDTNHIRVGFIEVDRETVYVGVRADLGRVVINHRGGGSVPLLTAKTAAELGALITRASAALPGIVAAHQEYRHAARFALEQFTLSVGATVEAPDD